MRCFALAHGLPFVTVRIGLVSDSPVTRRGLLWPQVFDAFAGVDAILHAGDVWSPAVIDELETIAPVHVARGNGDFGVEDERYQEQCFLSFEEVDVAMLHDFPSPSRRPADFVLAQAGKRFPRAPDVIVCGHTHIEEVHRLGGLLLVNPGSPTLPRNKSQRLGTIAFLTIAGASASAELCQLTEDGHRPIDG